MSKEDLINYCINNCQFINDKEDAINVISEILDISKTKIYFIVEFKENEVEKIKNIILQLDKGKPIAKILNRVWFYGNEFYVNENVLTPRQDSELIVYLTDECLKNNNKYTNVLDLCCGSGCLGLTLKSLNPYINIDLSDISNKALEVAKVNADKLRIEANFIMSNLFTNISKKYDIIISNPPYIKTNEIDNLEIQVKNFDPYVALDGYDDGLYFYREIAKNVCNYLNDNGILICEFGYDQAKDIEQIFKDKFKYVQIYKDNGGNDRAVVCKNMKLGD